MSNPFEEDTCPNCSRLRLGTRHECGGVEQAPIEIEDAVKAVESVARKLHADLTRAVTPISEVG